MKLRIPPIFRSSKILLGRYHYNYFSSPVIVMYLENKKSIELYFICKYEYGLEVRINGKSIGVWELPQTTKIKDIIISYIGFDLGGNDMFIKSEEFGKIFKALISECPSQMVNLFMSLEIL